MWVSLRMSTDGRATEADVLGAGETAAGDVDATGGLDTMTGADSEGAGGDTETDALGEPVGGLKDEVWDDAEAGVCGLLDSPRQCKAATTPTPARTTTSSEPSNFARRPLFVRRWLPARRDSGSVMGFLSVNRPASGHDHRIQECAVRRQYRGDAPSERAGGRHAGGAAS
jgi:hypothetical protein